MNSLFDHPVDTNLICAVRLLKVSNLEQIFLQIFVLFGEELKYALDFQLTGSVLDDMWKESGKKHMEELIQRIEVILLDATCSRCVY